MPPGYEWVTSLPTWMQALVMLGLGIAGFFWGKGGYKAGEREPPVKAQDVVLTAAGIMDLDPVRKMEKTLGLLVEAECRSADEIKRCADELGTIRQILAEDAESRQDARREDDAFRRGVAEGRRERGDRISR